MTSPSSTIQTVAVCRVLLTLGAGSARLWPPLLRLGVGRIGQGLQLCECAGLDVLTADIDVHIENAHRQTADFVDSRGGPEDDPMQEEAR